jgi:hypothetical protein
MIPHLHVIIVKDEKMHRETFKLPEIPVQEFDPSAHWNTFYNWEGSDDFIKDGIRVWTTVQLSEEERKYLVELGKLSVYKPNFPDAETNQL